MSKNLKTASINELEELEALICDMIADIDTYCHVSDYLPSSIIESLDSFHNKVRAEIDQRLDNE